MHGNMVFSTHYILGTPQQSGGFLVCSVEHCSNHSLNFFINVFFFTKWLPAAILDVQNSLSMDFFAISDQYETFFFFKTFYKMVAGAHFGCPKFTLDRISGHFR